MQSFTRRLPLKTKERTEIRNFDDWQIGKGYSMVYTENPVISKELQKEFGEPATYARCGKTIGWQWTVQQKLVPILRDRYGSVRMILGTPSTENAEKIGVENQALTGT
jgi:hypothetical protein